MASATEENLITVLETAKWLGVSKAKVHDLLARGVFRSVKVDSARRIYPSSVAKYLDRVSEGGDQCGH